MKKLRAFPSPRKIVHNFSLEVRGFQRKSPCDFLGQENFGEIFSGYATRLDRRVNGMKTREKLCRVFLGQENCFAILSGRALHPTRYVKNSFGIFHHQENCRSNFFWKRGVQRKNCGFFLAKKILEEIFSGFAHFS